LALAEVAYQRLLYAIKPKNHQSCISWPHTEKHKGITDEMNDQHEAGNPTKVNYWYFPMGMSVHM